MLNLTRPRYLLPVHGEYRHLLGHARLAGSVGLPADRVFVLEDGMGLEVTATEARVVGRFPAGRVLVDGKGIGDIGAVVLRDRQLLANEGLVAVSLAVDRDGAVVAGPEIASRGVVYVKENEALLEELRAAVAAVLAERSAAAPFDRQNRRRAGADGGSPVHHPALPAQARGVAHHPGGLMSGGLRAPPRPPGRSSRPGDPGRSSTHPRAVKGLGLEGRCP